MPFFSQLPIGHTLDLLIADILHQARHVINALLVTGLVLLPIGVIALGVTMFKAPAFGKGFGGLSMVIGILGVVAGIVLLIDPGSSIAIVSVLSLIVFHLVLGWKVYRLSRAPSGVLKIEERAGALKTMQEDHAGRKSGRARASRRDVETISERHGWRLSCCAVTQA